MRVELGEVCERGSSNLKQSDVSKMNGKYPIYGASGYIGNVDFYHQDQPYVAVVKDGAGIGRTTLHPAKSSVIGTMQYLLPKENILPEYLFYVVKYMHLEKYFTGATIPHIYFKDYQHEEFNLDPIEKQVKIVTILKKCEKIIDDRKKEMQLLDDLIKARFVELFGNPDINENNWDTYKMEQLCEVGSSKRIYQNEQSMTGIPFLRISDLVNRMDTGSKDSDLFIPEERFEELKKQGLVPESGDILLTARGTLGRCYIIQDNDEFYFQDGMITWLSKYDVKITSLYISYLFEMPGFRKQIDSLQAGSTVAYLSISMTKKLDIMVPPLELQNEFSDFVHQVDKSKFVAFLKQANTDSSKMAEVIGVSEAQLRFVTNTTSGMGLIKCGSVVIPFDNQISKDTDLYRFYNTNIHEKIAMMKKEKLPEKVIERSGES